MAVMMEFDFEELDMITSALETEIESNVSYLRIQDELTPEGVTEHEAYIAKMRRLYDRIRGV